MVPRTICVAAVVVAVIAASTSPPGSEAGRAVDNVAAAAHAKGLHVVRTRLLDAKGRVVHLRGVNRSGTEYACVQGWGIFDGPNDAASVKAMATWHINIVRIPLNEQCWLNINGVDPKYAGNTYRDAVKRYVSLLHRYHMYAELSLMWAAPADKQATYQPGGPDEDHSPAMWASMAATFKDDPNVILAPWGETVTQNADCFLHGGFCGATFFGIGDYKTAGMQQAVTVMRRAGYRGVIAIPGINYANDLSKWLSHEPKDPLHQLIAEAHIYGKNTCDTTACFDATIAPVARRVPVVFGETGEVWDNSSCGSSYISTFLRWADAHGVGYETWTWDMWRPSCSQLALITDYSGQPANEYGNFVKSYYADHAASTHGPGS